MPRLILTLLLVVWSTAWSRAESASAPLAVNNIQWGSMTQHNRELFDSLGLERREDIEGHQFWITPDQNIIVMADADGRIFEISGNVLTQRGNIVSAPGELAQATRLRLKISFTKTAIDEHGNLWGIVSLEKTSYVVLCQADEKRRLSRYHATPMPTQAAGIRRGMPSCLFDGPSRPSGH